MDIFGHFYLNHLSPLWGYFLVSEKYQCDEVSILIFAGMFHIHVDVIVND